MAENIMLIAAGGLIALIVTGLVIGLVVFLDTMKSDLGALFIFVVVVIAVGVLMVVSS
ncbi:MAG: hypothetical protein K0M49_16880 [Arenimonas sp.]|nr:hypothetical protein [Rhizobium sp.]MBW8447298.1 hypothetical protein [Arenimonas sp.]